MSTLFRYLAKEILVSSALLLLALLALFALFDLISELGDLGRGNYSLTRVLAYVTLSQPSHVVVIFPLAALLGTLLAISRLSSHSELTVMRASGLSLTRLAGYAALIGLVFSGVIFLFGEFVAPMADEAAKQVKNAATSKIVAKRFRSGFWVKDDHSFLNIQGVTPESELTDVRIYEFDDRHRLLAIKLAKRAVYDTAFSATNGGGNGANSKGRWLLSDVETTSLTGDKARITRTATDYWSSAMKPDLMAALRVRPYEMSISNLSSYIDHLRDNKQSSTQYEWAFWSKLFQPAAVIVMMLLAIPFAINSHRASGVGAKLLLGVSIGMAFYFLSQLTSHLTVVYNWPPLLSAGAPAALFFLIAIALLAWRERPVSFFRVA
jgi:lipopolysaccharide export system permease protein